MLDDALQFLKENWSFPHEIGRLEHLVSYGDTIYKVFDRETGAPTHTLRFTAAPASLPRLETERAVLALLTRDPGGYAFPCLCPTTGGALSCAFGDARVARVLTWVPGPLWAEDPSPDSEGDLEALGALLGHLARVLAPLAAAGAVPVAEDFAWAPERAMAQLAHALPLHADGGERALLLRGAGAFMAARAALAAAPRGVVHNDANEANLCAGARGLLDFGDCCASWRLADVAIAATYAFLRRDDADVEFKDVCAPIVAGYRRNAPLEPVEVALLRAAAVGRLVQSLCASRLALEAAVSGAEHARYVGVHRERALRALAALTESSRAGRPVAPVRAARDWSLRAVAAPHPGDVVEARGCWLLGEGADGARRVALDLGNNVAHVGHAHAGVAHAVHAQLLRVNGSTRVPCARRERVAAALLAQLPGLQRLAFAASGTEANEMALRLARARTGRSAVLALEGGYHGHSTALVELSHYKCRGLPPPTAPRVFAPCPSRGVPLDAALAGLVEALDRLEARGTPPALLLLEPLPSCAGQVVPPRGYLRRATALARARGALVAFDEVQTGVGRCGRFCAYQALEEDVVPDLMTLGKPLGNGMAAAAVACTADVARAFDRLGVELFSTFGGSQAAMAATDAVLAEVSAAGLMAHANEMGARLQRGLRAVLRAYPAAAAAVPDVRGLGLFVGVEFADPRELSRFKDFADALGVLVNQDGLRGEVWKIKPPMVIAPEEIDFVVSVFHHFFL